MRATLTLIVQLALLLALLIAGALVVDAERPGRILTSWIYTSPTYEPDAEEMEKVLSWKYGYDCESKDECKFQQWFARKAKGVKDVLQIVGVVLGCFIVALACWLTSRWVVTTVLPPVTVAWPRLKSKAARLTSAVSKDAFAARRMRSADEEFQQLQRLHQSGLLTDDQFAKRKLAIQSRLENMDV